MNVIFHPIQNVTADAWVTWEVKRADGTAMTVNTI
jgi:hypothetical protein